VLADADDAAVIEHDDEIGPRDRAVAAGDDERCAIAHHVFEGFLRPSPSPFYEAGPVLGEVGMGSAVYRRLRGASRQIRLGPVFHEQQRPQAARQVHPGPALGLHDPVNARGIENAALDEQAVLQ